MKTIKVEIVYTFYADVLVEDTEEYCDAEILSCAECDWNNAHIHPTLCTVDSRQVIND